MSRIKTTEEDLELELFRLRDLLIRVADENADLIGPVIGNNIAKIGRAGAFREAANSLTDLIEKHFKS